MPEETFGSIGEASQAAMDAVEEGGLSPDAGETAAPEGHEESAAPLDEAATPGEEPGEGGERAGEGDEPAGGEGERVRVLGRDGQIYEVSQDEQQEYIRSLGLRAYYDMLTKAEQEQGADEGGEGGDAGEASSDAAPEGAGDEKKTEQPTELEKRLGRLEALEREKQVRAQQEQFMRNLNQEVDEAGLKDAPGEVKDVVRKFAMAAISVDNRMSEKEAVKVAHEALDRWADAQRKAAVGKKAKRALSGEGGGGGEVASQAPKGLTADDLLRGRVAEAAMKSFVGPG